MEKFKETYTRIANKIEKIILNICLKKPNRFYIIFILLNVVILGTSLWISYYLEWLIPELIFQIRSTIWLFRKSIKIITKLKQNESLIQIEEDKIRFTIVSYIGTSILILNLLLSYNTNFSNWDYPFTLVKEDFVFDESTSKISATIVGVISPLFALLAAYLTYKAFSGQLKQGVVNRFYEALKLHRENLKEIKKNKFDGQKFEGRRTFIEFFNEIELIYFCVDRFYTKHYKSAFGSEKKWVINEKWEKQNITYLLFFFGIYDESINSDMFKESFLNEFQGNQPEKAELLTEVEIDLLIVYVDYKITMSIKPKFNERNQNIKRFENILKYKREKFKKFFTNEIAPKIIIFFNKNSNDLRISNNKRKFLIEIRDKIKEVLKEIDSIKNDYGVSKYVFKDIVLGKKGNLNPLNDETIEFHYELLRGHQSRLGHYFRHLYGISKMIRRNNELSDKYYYNILRNQLSNHEQLILYYNASSLLGINWFRHGFIKESDILHNMPIEMVHFGFDVYSKKPSYNDFILFDEWKDEWFKSFEKNYNQKFELESEKVKEKLNWIIKILKTSKSD